MKFIKLTKSCKHCNENFLTSKANKLFCSRKCKESHTTFIRRENAQKLRLKRLKTREFLLNGSAFARYLVTEVKRAGTLEILHKVTSNELLEILKITRNRTKYNGIYKGKVERHFEISHIIAVKDPSRLGLLHPLNMVIAPSNFNRKRGTYSSLLNVGLNRAFLAMTSLIFYHRKFACILFALLHDVPLSNALSLHS